VDLYLMPTYDDMASLSLRKGTWMIHYGFPPAPEEPTDLPLDEGTLNQVLDSITANAAPSF